MRRRRGVALLIVLATVAVMTTVVMGFVHDSQVRSRIAANARDSCAYFLARSGMELAAHDRLHEAVALPCQQRRAAAQNLSAGTTKSGGGSSPATCEDETPHLQQMLNLPPTPFWKMIPITSELFQGVADGSFGAMLGVPSPPLVMGVESADRRHSSATSMRAQESCLATCQGRSPSMIDDEDRKIPLKSLWKGSQRRTEPR